jgi:hypothetical protein
MLNAVNFSVDLRSTTAAKDRRCRRMRNDLYRTVYPEVTRKIPSACTAVMPLGTAMLASVDTV